MKHTVAILQSCYIPWKGYFDLLGSVDEFILYDDMQYTRRDWRNRNRIKTPQGLAWLSVPVQVKGRYHQSVRDTLIDGTGWAATHWKTIVQNYRHAPCFDAMAARFEALYRRADAFTHLSELNRALMEAVCAELGIGTRLRWSSEFVLAEGKVERLVDLCSQVGATDYVSGPAARDYIDERQFEAADIRLHYFDYSGYPAYPQQWGAFEHGVSVLDLLFNCGDRSRDFMKLAGSTPAAARHG